MRGFFFCSQRVEGIVCDCHASALLSFEQHGRRTPPLSRMPGACLLETKHSQEKSGVFLGFLTFVSTILPTSYQRGVQGGDGPGEALAPCPGEQTSQRAHQGSDGKGPIQDREASNAARGAPVPVILSNSLPSSFAAVVHKFNLQFSRCQEPQEPPSPAQPGRMGPRGHKRSANEVWVTTGARAPLAPSAGVIWGLALAPRGLIRVLPRKRAS